MGDWLVVVTSDYVIIVHGMVLALLRVAIVLVSQLTSPKDDLQKIQNQTHPLQILLLPLPLRMLLESCTDDDTTSDHAVAGERRWCQYHPQVNDDLLCTSHAAQLPATVSSDDAQCRRYY